MLQDDEAKEEEGESLGFLVQSCCGIEEEKKRKGKVVYKLGNQGDLYDGQTLV